MEHVAVGDIREVWLDLVDCDMCGQGELRPRVLLGLLLIASAADCITCTTGLLLDEGGDVRLRPDLLAPDLPLMLDVPGIIDLFLGKSRTTT